MSRVRSLPSPIFRASPSQPPNAGCDPEHAITASVYIYLYVYVSIHTYLHNISTCLHIYTHVHTHTHIHTCDVDYTDTRARTHTHTNKVDYLHAHAHAHAHARTRTHARTHARTHTHIPGSSRGWKIKKRMRRPSHTHSSVDMLWHPSSPDAITCVCVCVRERERESKSEVPGDKMRHGASFRHERRHSSLPRVAAQRDEHQKYD